MKSSLSLIALLFALSSTCDKALAGDVLIEARGRVAANWLSSGPFAGVAVGDQVSMRMEGFVPGSGSPTSGATVMGGLVTLLGAWLFLRRRA